jgi:hypothetical protein
VHRRNAHLIPWPAQAAHVAALAAILALALTVMLVTGFLSVRGWGDWAIGTNAHYCGAYLPHWDFYCQAAS